MAQSCTARYRARNPRATPLYRLFEAHFDDVGHAQWVFVMPKMLRPYFLHHRDLLGGLAHAAWETVLELMCAAHVRGIMGVPRSKWVKGNSYPYIGSAVA